MKTKPKAKESFAARMCAKLGARTNAPQRYAALSPREEKIRCELTWQMNDERLWIAAFSLPEELSNWVGAPTSFIERRRDTWLVYSDQIPFWVKIGFLKILYASFELDEVEKRKNRKRALKHKQMSQALTAPPAESEMSGQTQKRGADPGGEKCRITFEARQDVSGFLDEGAEVRGHILPSILVVKGQYARLDNIDAAGNCKKD